MPFCRQLSYAVKTAFCKPLGLLTGSLEPTAKSSYMTHLPDVSWPSLLTHLLAILYTSAAPAVHIALSIISKVAV